MLKLLHIAKQHDYQFNENWFISILADFLNYDERHEILSLINTGKTFQLDHLKLPLVKSIENGRVLWQFKKEMPAAEKQSVLAFFKVKST